jgi:hypothetical protein
MVGISQEHSALKQSNSPLLFSHFLTGFGGMGVFKIRKSVDTLLEIFKSYRGVDENWIDSIRHEFVFCLELFFRFKKLDSALAQLRSRTQLIPEGADSAY